MKAISRAISRALFSDEGSYGGTGALQISILEYDIYCVFYSQNRYNNTSAEIIVAAVSITSIMA